MPFVAQKQGAIQRLGNLKTSTRIQDRATRGGAQAVQASEGARAAKATVTGTAARPRKKGRRRR